MERLEMSIPSDFKYLGAVDAVVQDVAREFSFSQKCINDISTALIEACTNAIEHGNRFSVEKRVKVVIAFDGDTIVTKVYDEGKGFDYEKYLAHKAPPDPLSIKGRGIIIMKAFSDRLQFSYEPGRGFCVEMAKKRKSGQEK